MHILLPFSPASNSCGSVKTGDSKKIDGFYEQTYLQQLVMMFSLVIDGSHRKRIQLVECNLE